MWGGIGIVVFFASFRSGWRGIHSKCIRKNKTYDIIKTSLTMDRIIKYGKVVCNGGSARQVCGRILLVPYVGGERYILKERVEVLYQRCQ